MIGVGPIPICFFKAIFQVSRIFDENIFGKLYAYDEIHLFFFLKGIHDVASF
jgi:hypothetical protein